MISEPQDGEGSNWMRLNVFDGPLQVSYPERDAAIAAETVLHEYTHAMVQRLVGHGVGLPDDSQWLSLNEGWSDFFALALLSQAAETGGNFAFGAYSMWYARNSNGLIGAWLMNGSSLQQSTLFNPNAPGHPNWKLVGSGDFNHDGQSDLVFQFQGASAPPAGNDGDMAVWLMNGTSVATASFGGYLLVFPQNPGDAFWRIVATADFDYDGVTDFLAQYQNPASPHYRNLALWLMDEAQWMPQLEQNRVPIKQGLYLNPTNPGTNWEVRGPR